MRVGALDERDAVALQQYPTWKKTHKLSINEEKDPVQLKAVPICFLADVFVLISTASSRTTFMYSSKPCTEPKKEGEMSARGYQPDNASLLTIIIPSIFIETFSKSQMWTLSLCSVAQ